MEALSHDEEVCARIIRTQLHSDMLSNLRSDSLSVASLNDAQSVEQRRFVQTQLSILHNVLTRSATGRSHFKQALDIIHKLSRVTAYPVSSRSSSFSISLPLVTVTSTVTHILAISRDLERSRP